MSDEGVEVNGKIDLGTRRLVVSYVENAASFYAYLESEKEFMKTIEQDCKKLCEGLPRLTEIPETEQMVCAYSGFQQTWFRGRVEQLGQGRSKDLIRVRAIDFGWNNLFKVKDLVEYPDALKDVKVLCEKYKMADLKPRGKFEGYSAEDRQRGGEWLKKTINDRVVICSCYKQVKYAGGIMADCMVGDINLNKAALKMGHVIFLPAMVVPQYKGKSAPNSNGVYPQEKKPYFNPIQNRFAQKQVQNQFQVNGGQGNVDGVDLDYSSYQGDVLFNGLNRGVQNGAGVLSRPSEGPAGRDSSLVVKKLEKKINEDKKVISELKKTTNLDVGIREIVKLMEKVAVSRDKVQEQENKGSNILSCLVGVAEVIEECSVVTDKYLAGVEAVDAAARRVAENKDGKENTANSTNSDLNKCIEQYLDIYNEEVLRDELTRVNNQLTDMNPNIPMGWKLLGVKAENVTRLNLLEVAENVKNWIEGSVSREAALTANSQKEVDSLCRALNQLSQGLQQKQAGTTSEDARVEIPTSLDSQLGSVRQALQAELYGRVGGIKSSSGRKGKEKKAGSNDAAVLKSAWKALTALKGQLETCQKKAEEYKKAANNA